MKKEKKDKIVIDFKKLIGYLNYNKITYDMIAEQVGPKSCRQYFYGRYNHKFYERLAEYFGMTWAKFKSEFEVVNVDE